MDTQLFLLINHLPHTALTDGLFRFLSGLGSSGFIWFVFGVLLYIREEQKYIKFFLPIAFAGGTSYILVEYILKPFIARVRPTLEMGAIIVEEGKSDFSMPSGHATIAFAMAGVLSAYEPRYKPYFYTIASLIAFSRIFLGVHYPGDVLVGALLGFLIARCAIYLFPRKKQL